MSLVKSFHEYTTGIVLGPRHRSLGLEAWSGCVNERLRNHVVSDEILSSSCEDLRDSCCAPLPGGMALKIRPFYFYGEPDGVVRRLVIPSKTEGHAS